ncbi:MAG: electron transfer flavoprotein subunit beta/FixA family protein [Syntrophaceae bacterium]|nr:electron transfer flavoprotein subunit beta/FixA family protein [Syntrophaceae bacterium]
MVTELPWDEKTGTLRRDLAPGMMNPACKHALEAALQIKEKYSAHITVITMGPPAAKEVLYEALAMGADSTILICDKILAGSDTYATSWILAQAINKQCGKTDLILCGAFTADSETAQVGPQLAERMNLPAVAYAEKIEINGSTLRVRRIVDNFRETMEMECPALVTVSMENYLPRYVGLSGLQCAFGENQIKVLDAAALGISAADIQKEGSRTKVRRVFLRKTQKENEYFTGVAVNVVNEFLNKYERKISTVISKSIEGKERTRGK